MNDLSMFSPAEPEQDLSMFSPQEDLSMFSPIKEESIVGYGTKLGASSLLGYATGLLTFINDRLQKDKYLASTLPTSGLEELKSQTTQAKEAFQSVTESIAKEAEAQKPEGFVPLVAGKTIALGMELPLFKAATTALGAVKGFAALGAVQEMGKEGATKLDIAKSAGLNAAMGKVLAIADKIPGGKGLTERLKRGVKTGALFGGASVTGQAASQGYEAAKSEEVDFDLTSLLSKENLADTTVMSLLGFLVGSTTKKGELTGKQKEELSQAESLIDQFVKEQGLGIAGEIKNPETAKLFIEFQDKVAKMSYGEVEKVKLKYEKKQKFLDRYFTSDLLTKDGDGKLMLTKSGSVNKNAEKILKQARHIENVNEWFKHPEYLEALKDSLRLFKPEEMEAIDRIKAEEEGLQFNREVVQKTAWDTTVKQNFIEEFKAQGQPAFEKALKLVEEASKVPPASLPVESKTKLNWLYDRFVAPLANEKGEMYIAEKPGEKSLIERAQKMGWEYFTISPSISSVEKKLGITLSEVERAKLKNITIVKVPSMDVKNLLPNEKSFELVVSGSELRNKVIDMKFFDEETLQGKPLPEMYVKVNPSLKSTSGKFYPKANKIEIESPTREQALAPIAHELTHWANIDRFPNTGQFAQGEYSLDYTLIDPVKSKITSVIKELKNNKDFLFNLDKKKVSFFDLVDIYNTGEIKDSASPLTLELNRLMKLDTDFMRERRSLAEIVAHSSEATIGKDFRTPEGQHPLKPGLETAGAMATSKPVEIFPDEILSHMPLDYWLAETVQSIRTLKPPSQETSSKWDSLLEKVLGYKPSSGAAEESFKVMQKSGMVRGLIQGMKDTKGDFSWLQSITRYIQTQPDVAKSHPTYRKIVESFRNELSGTSRFIEEYQEKLLPTLRASLKEQKELNKLVLFGEKIKDPVKAKAFREQASKISPLFQDYLNYMDKFKPIVVEQLRAEMKHLTESEAKILSSVIEAVQSDLVYFPHIWFGKWGNLSKGELKSFYLKPLAIFDNMARKGKVMDLSRGLAEEGGANYNVLDFSLRLMEQLPLRRLSKRYPGELSKVINEIAEQDISDFVMLFKHLKERKGVEGYNTDVIRVSAEYLNTIARAYNRSKYLPEQMAALAEIDPKTKLFQHARDTLRYHVQNKSFEVSKLRQALVYTYMAVLKSALGQGAQTWSMAAPYLSLLAKEFKPQGGKSGYAKIGVETAKWGVRQVLSPERIADMSKFLDNLDKDLTGRKTLLSLVSEGMGRLSESARKLSNKLTNSEEAGILAYAHYMGWTKATYVPELLGARGGAMHRMFSPRFHRAATFLLRNSEIYSKETTFMSAYKIMKNAGVPQMEALKLAGKFTEDILANYSGIFKPPVARGILALPTALGIYPFFQGQHLKNLLFKQREFSTFTKILAGTALIGGVRAGIPLYYLWEKLYEDKTGRNLHLDITQASKKLGTQIHPKASEAFEEIAYGGLPGYLLGIDLSPQVQIADYPMLRSGDISGILGNVVDRVKQAYRLGKSQDWRRFIESVSPEALRMPLVGFRLRLHGMVSTKGTPLGQPSQVNQPISNTDFYKFLVGVYPSSVRKAGDFERAVRNHESWKAAAKLSIIDKLVIGYSEMRDGGRNEKYNNALKELNDWNSSVRPQDMIEVNPQDIKRRVTQPFKAYRYFLEQELKGGEDE